VLGHFFPSGLMYLIDLIGKQDNASPVAEVDHLSKCGEMEGNECMSCPVVSALFLEKQAEDTSCMLDSERHWPVGLPGLMITRARAWTSFWWASSTTLSSSGTFFGFLTD